MSVQYNLLTENIILLNRGAIHGAVAWYIVLHKVGILYYI